MPVSIAVRSHSLTVGDQIGGRQIQCLQSAQGALSIVTAKLASFPGKRSAAVYSG
jgi:hypothetical protein